VVVAVVGGVVVDVVGGGGVVLAVGVLHICVQFHTGITINITTHTHTHTHISAATVDDDDYDYDADADADAEAATAATGAVVFASSDAIDMAFSKRRVEDRKKWLNAYQTGTHVDYTLGTLSYTEFVNKELILFSMADNHRSIPSVVDGLKPAQRKVLFSCFKRKLKNEIKVAQLAG